MGLKIKRFMNHEAVKNIEMIVGYYGVLSGVILFLYYYFKVEGLMPYLFLASGLCGVFLILSTKKRVLNDKTTEIKLSEI